jgi:protein-disulfide isomerase
MFRHPLVNKDVEEGIHVGVTGIPTFFINGQRLVGAQPRERFVRVLQEELRGRGEGVEPSQ